MLTVIKNTSVDHHPFLGGGRCLNLTFYLFLLIGAAIFFKLPVKILYSGVSRNRLRDFVVHMIRNEDMRT